MPTYTKNYCVSNNANLCFTSSDSNNANLFSMSKMIDMNMCTKRNKKI